MAASISAVAAICVSAPARTQGQKTSGGRGSAAPVTSSTPARNEQRERKAEQEAHMGGADGAERRGQLALRGVARGLRRRGDQREDGPEPGSSIMQLVHRHASDQPQHATAADVHRRSIGAAAEARDVHRAIRLPLAASM